jgi:cytochrome c
MSQPISITRMATRSLLIASAILAMMTTMSLAQDVDKGETIFKKCKACHFIGEGAKNKTGPFLTDVIGRTAGSVEGYKYSKSMRQAGEAGLVWDEPLLFDYLAGPKDFLRAYLDDPKAKAKMPLRLKKEQDRLDVIAYLATFSTAPAVEIAVCTRNASNERYFFAAEITGQQRLTKWLKPGETLCAPAMIIGAHGVVSVFESQESLEGCSRLVDAGQVEDMVKYADFDRCKWGGHEE